MSCNFMGRQGASFSKYISATVQLLFNYCVYPGNILSIYYNYTVAYIFSLNDYVKTLAGKKNPPPLMAGDFINNSVLSVDSSLSYMLLTVCE